MAYLNCEEVGMAKSHISQYGSGIGGPVQVVADPNRPSFDPSTSSGRDKQIMQLLESSGLTDWERKFLLSIYGIERMSEKQRRVFVRVSMRIRAIGTEE